MKIKSTLAAIALLGLCQSSFAVNKWYWGEVSQIITTGADGSFVVTLDNATIQSTCAFQRVSFFVADMGAERTKLAFAMALAAHASGTDWGVVVDLPSAGGTCTASPTSTQGAGTR